MGRRDRSAVTGPLACGARVADDPRATPPVTAMVRWLANARKGGKTMVTTTLTDAFRVPGYAIASADPWWEPTRRR